MAQVYMWNGRIAYAIELYETVFDRLVPAGAAINEPEAIVWGALAAFNAGDLAKADALADRLLEEATRRSPHTRSHAYGLKALLLLARGRLGQRHRHHARSGRTGRGEPGYGLVPGRRRRSRICSDCRPRGRAATAVRSR